jgi:hypothetical protein
MNYSVHSIMYTYFALTATSTFRSAALRVAPLITGLQISQFAWGTVINVIAAVSYSSPNVGCAIQLPILHLAAFLYCVYGALFVQLFVQRYVRRQKAAPTRAGDGHAGRNGDAHANGVGNGSEDMHAGNMKAV